jgi:hypothetical protein
MYDDPPILGPNYRVGAALGRGRHVGKANHEVYTPIPVAEGSPQR